MWFEFFQFELRHQMRQPLLWATALIFGLLALGSSASDFFGGMGSTWRNAPFVIMGLFSGFSLLAMFMVAVFIAGPVLRDTEIGIADMIFATPMRKRDYLIGRFLAGFALCLLIFVPVIIGMMLGPIMPWVDPAGVGPFSLRPFVWGFFIIVIPNLLFIGALLMMLAATTRSMLMVYVGVLAFVVLWAVAAVITIPLSQPWLSVLLDPFGSGAFSMMTRYYSIVEMNTRLPPLNSYMLGNRVFWLGISVILMAVTLLLFKPQRQGTGRSWFGRAKQKITTTATHPAAVPIRLRQIVPTMNSLTPWLQCWHLFCFDSKAVFKSVPFLLMLVLAIGNFIGIASMAGTLFGTNVYPVTRVMLNTLNEAFNTLLMLIVMFYGGELIFKERQAKMADITDLTPVPDWVPLLAKSLTLIVVVVGFLLAGVLAAIYVQSNHGGVTVDVLPYFKNLALGATPFVLMALCGLCLQVFGNNKYLGYLLVIALYVLQWALPTMHVDHNLLRFAGLPSVPYSDMNGFGHFVQGWAWFALYWAWFVLGLLILAHAFWVRGGSGQGASARTRVALARLRGRSGVALAFCMFGFIGSGAWIFYNTNVINQYQASDVALDWRANYEKRFRQYQNLPHPKITAVRADVAIFPQQRRVTIVGHYVLQNKTAAALDTLRIQTSYDRNVVSTWHNLPPHQVTLTDKQFGFTMIKLNQALLPGARLELDFTVNVSNPGFTNNGAPNSINLNGSFFNNKEFFPQFGYNPQVELTDINERRKRGLGVQQRMAKLEDNSARDRHMFNGEADWVDFETTVSTSADQIGLAPGYLQKTWVQDGRRYFQYKMDTPILPYFAWLSAQWEVKKSQWRGLPVEIYYDKKHAFNVDRMILSSQKSLDYYTAQFGDYPHRQLRILEFPAYQAFAQSFPNTIPYSESLGFIADLRNQDDLDHVFYVTAHEVAHQWWGHQVVGANVQGAGMLAESLAQYSALMAMEKEYGRAKMRRFLRYEMDRYLAGRGGQNAEELPLYRVEGQQFIHYHKGSLVFYRLRDEIGEVALNRALRLFLRDKAFQAGRYTTSAELLGYIRAETPQDKQTLITDMFEKIVLYDNRVIAAQAKPLGRGKWEVTMKLHLGKVEADGKGVETSRKFDEPVEIAVFARPEGGAEKDERVLFSEKRWLRGDEPSVTLIVNAKPFGVGVDPYNLLIDRVASDNRKEVVIE